MNDEAMFQAIVSIQNSLDRIVAATERTADAVESIVLQQAKAIEINPGERVKDVIDQLRQANPVFGAAFDALDRMSKPDSIGPGSTGQVPSTVIRERQHRTGS